MNVYPFVEAEEAGGGNVAMTCRCMEVSRSAYYEWSEHEPSQRDRNDAALLEQIQRVHAQSRETYGSPRVYDELRDEGIACGRHPVAKLMPVKGIVGREPRRFKTTTIPDPDALTVAVDLVKRAFGPGTIELDTIYVGDITYIRTWEGWAYLATVIDLASRKVVGWAMADHMRASLVCEALQAALDARRPAPGLVFHSDRGCQYTSAEFAELLEAHGVVQSLSRPGQCWDNAVAESFFSTLKSELIHRHAWPTRAKARLAVFDYVESFYNTRRRHSSLGSLSPVNYERRITRGPSSTTEAA
jgi:transposase InsO family protein